MNNNNRQQEETFDQYIVNSINEYKQRLKTETNENQILKCYFMISVLNDCRGRSSEDEVNDILERKLNYIRSIINEQKENIRSR